MKKIYLVISGEHKHDVVSNCMKFAPKDFVATSLVTGREICVWENELRRLEGQVNICNYIIRARVKAGVE